MAKGPDRHPAVTEWSVSAFTDSMLDAQKVEAAGAQNASVLLMTRIMFPA